MQSNYINSNKVNQIGIIADQNVLLLFPFYFDELKKNFPCHIFTVLPGENNKSIEEATYLWQNLLEHNFDHNSLIINFGGGTITDLGGFVASTFKRGIPFINVPTTLLGMIDAAVGGKTGINLNHAKNMVGTICLPQEVVIDTQFLKTLPPYELLNGFGELIKYSLIRNSDLWKQIQTLQHIRYQDIKKEWINNCIHYKNEIITIDLQDKGPRHILNFGHTIGHALESCFLNSNIPLSHGHAVALGMVAESFLSYRHQLLSEEEYLLIRNFILQFYLFPKSKKLLNDKQVPTDYFKKEFLKYCHLDKKNTNNNINITMLECIGQASPDHSVSEDECWHSLSSIFTNL